MSALSIIMYVITMFCKVELCSYIHLPNVRSKYLFLLLPNFFISITMLPYESNKRLMFTSDLIEISDTRLDYLQIMDWTIIGYDKNSIQFTIECKIGIACLLQFH